MSNTRTVMGERDMTDREALEEARRRWGKEGMGQRATKRRPAWLGPFCTEDEARDGAFSRERKGFAVGWKSYRDPGTLVKITDPVGHAAVCDSAGAYRFTHIVGKNLGGLFFVEGKGWSWRQAFADVDAKAADTAVKAAASKTPSPAKAKRSVTKPPPTQKLPRISAPSPKKRRGGAPKVPPKAKRPAPPPERAVTADQVAKEKADRAAADLKRLRDAIAEQASILASLKAEATPLVAIVRGYDQSECPHGNVARRRCKTCRAERERSPTYQAKTAERMRRYRARQRNVTKGGK